MKTYLILSSLLATTLLNAAEDFSFPSSDQTKLHAVYYAADKPQSFLFVVHGLQSHTGWFNSGDAYAAQGISSFAFDRRGSGLSEGMRGHADTVDNFMNDFAAALDQLNQRNIQHLPIDVMANSLGGVIAINYLSTHPGVARSLILTTPGTNVTPAADYSFLQKLSILSSPALNYFPTPLHDEQFVEPGPFLDWIHNDQLADRQFTAAFLRAVNTMKSNVATSVKALKLPLFLMLAQQDEVIDNSGVVKDVYTPYTGTKSIKYYTSKHYLFFGTDRDKVSQDIVSWTQQQ